MKHQGMIGFILGVTLATGAHIWKKGPSENHRDPASISTTENHSSASRKNANFDFEVLQNRDHVSAFQKNGVVFSCKTNEIAQITAGMNSYLAELKIDLKHITKKTSPDGSKLGFELNTPFDDTNTLNLGKRPEYNIKDEIVDLPIGYRKYKTVATVSRKEIVLSLFQHGRLTQFKGSGCSTQAFKDHVGIRQNIAAWAERLGWGFPDDRASSWNPKYWDKSPLHRRGELHEAINDAFLNQHLYSIGCYTATKMVMSQGILDYYRRIRPDPEKLRKIQDTMLENNNPLAYIEPGSTWEGFISPTPEELRQPGKILGIQKGVAKRNFIAGDWVYIKNNDFESSNMSGYEGSNAIYLGRNNFDDYYGETPMKHYTFEEKVDEVYQWRHGVFTASEASQAKRKNITEKEFEQLLESPSSGGLLMDHRLSPLVF